MQRMLAAQVVRRAFLTRMITAPNAKHSKVMTAWALARLVGRDSTVARHLPTWTDDGILGPILGVDQPNQVLGAAPEHRHGVLAWTVTCAAYETEFPKDAWRNNDDRRAVYLAHLVSLGYTPCDTEQLMIDRLTSTDAPDSNAEPSA